LAAQRLRPALVSQRIDTARAELAALDRVRRSLDPKAPLRRGYVLVTDAAGELVRSRAAAQSASLLHLEFADGVLEVAPGSAPTAQVSRAPAKPRAAPAPGDTQPKLL
jgi:exodeoxyribonuclease VII large subunit